MTTNHALSHFWERRWKHTRQINITDSSNATQLDIWVRRAFFSASTLSILSVIKRTHRSIFSDAQDD